MRWLILALTTLLFTAALGIEYADVVNELRELGIDLFGENPDELMTSSNVALVCLKLYDIIDAKVKNISREIEDLYNPLSEKIDNLSEKLDGVEKKLDLHVRDISDMDKKMNQLYTELSELKSQIHELFSRFSELEKDRSTLEGLRSDYKKLEARIGLLEGRYVDTSSELKHVKESLDELGKKLEDHISGISSSLEDTRKAVVSQGSRLDSLETLSAKLEDLVKTLSSNQELLYKAVRSNKETLKKISESKADREELENLRSVLSGQNSLLWTSLAISSLALLISLIILGTAFIGGS